MDNFWLYAYEVLSEIDLINIRQLLYTELQNDLEKKVDSEKNEEEKEKIKQEGESEILSILAPYDEWINLKKENISFIIDSFK